MAVNVSATPEDVTALSGKHPPGRGEMGAVLQGPVPQGERATKWAACVRRA